MGRELRRVPLDFDWPQGKVWHGYRNPHYRKCADCGGYGYTAEYKRFEEFCRRIALVGEQSYIRPDDFVEARPRYSKPIHEQLMDDMYKARMAQILGHDDFYEKDTDLPRWPWPEHDPVDTLLKAAKMTRENLTDTDINVIKRLARTVKTNMTYPQTLAIRQEGSHKLMVVPNSSFDRYVQNYPHPYLLEDGIGDAGENFHKVAIALGARGDRSFGWDGVWDIMKNIFRTVGLPSYMRKSEYSDMEFETFDWGRCQAGCDDGVAADAIEAYKAWEDFEPPEGEGFQLWETTSEGSPSSPVFKTLEALCEWCASNATTFGSNKASKEQWMQMLDDGFVHHTQGGVTFI